MMRAGYFMRGRGIMFIVAALMMLGIDISQAQICLPDITPLSTPTSRFSISTDGNYVLDTVTGLYWQRCAVGQIWNGTNNICEYDPNKPIKYTWAEALTEAATQATASGYSWRVPNIKEMVSIVDFQCMGPAFNQDVFPDTPTSLSNGFWTSTPYQTNFGNAANNPFAWFINANNGKTGFKAINTTETNFLHLVCGASPNNPTGCPAIP